MNLYVACSLTNVPAENFNEYTQFIQKLHIQLESNGFNIENALSNSSPFDSTLDSLVNAKNCYNWHKELITQSDVVIAEVSFPSLGVGIELQLANQLGIPTYLIYNPCIASTATSKSFKNDKQIHSTTNITHDYISSMALGMDCVKNVLSYTEYEAIGNEITSLLNMHV